MKRGSVSRQPTTQDPYRFMFVPDIHWGWEVVDGKKRPTHNLAAVRAMLAFARDFRPDGFLLGGDQLDLAAISHHNERRRLGVEGLRIQQDVDEFSAQVMAPLEEIGISDLWWMVGNHEAWLHQFTDIHSGLADTLTYEKLFNLEARGWREVAQGGHVDLGKLRFVHGDRLAVGDNAAKAAVIQHHKSIMFGHLHTHQQHIAHSPVDASDIHIGVAVPALANRGPAYGKRAANRWANGFAFGVIHPSGVFNHYVPIITDGRLWANGKLYQG